MMVNLFGRGRPLRWAITSTCQLSFVFMGYDQGFMAGLIGNPDFLNTVRHPKSNTIGIMLSIFTLGAFSGCIVNLVNGDRLGRIRSLWLGFTCVLIGATIQCSSFSLAQLMVGRYIAGIGVGIISATAPMFQAELCEPTRRGRLVCSQALFIAVGLVISAFFDYGMLHILGSVGWRVPMAFQLSFVLACCILLLGLPESPRWLYSKGRNEEALQVLCDVYDHDETHPSTLKEQDEILEALKMEHAATEVSWRKMFKNDEVRTRRRVLLAYGAQFINQMCGATLIVYYIPTILKKDVGLSQDMSVLVGAIVDLAVLIGVIIGTAIIDRVGRRKPLMWGCFALGLCLMLACILLSFKTKSIQPTTSKAAVAFFFLYMLSYGITAGIIPWCYVPEVLPLHIRGKATALVTSSNWLWNFFIVMTAPAMLDGIGEKAYLIYMGISFLFIPLVYFYYPDLTRLSLEEVDLVFADHDTSAVKVASMYQKQMKEQGRDVMMNIFVEAMHARADYHEVVEKIHGKQ